MTKILELQNWILRASPGLLPLLGIGYSALTSLHCSLMCSPFLPAPKDRHSFYLARSFGYMTVGIVLGAFGQVLIDLLEFKLVSILAFFVFAALTLSLAGLRLFPKFPKHLNPRNTKTQTSFVKGILMASMPCHSLYFFYSLAVLSASPWGGGLILLGHALASTPALAYSSVLLKKLTDRFYHSRLILRGIILLLCLLNLTYFGSRLFMSEAESKSKILFCL